MRNRPTPSAPASAPACALFGSPTLASSRIRRPSDVAPSPLQTSLGAAPRGHPLLGVLDRGVVGLDVERARAAVEHHRGALGHAERARGGDDGRHAQRPGQDRRVAGRPALGGDEAEHLLRVDGRGVRGREVAGHEDERVARVGDAGHRDAEHGGDDPVADVLDVGHARADVAAGGGEHVAEGVRGLEHGAGRRQVPLDHAGDREVHHARVDRHVRRRLEHGPGLGLRLLRAGAQLGGHRLHGGRDPGAFRVRVPRL